MSAEVRIKDEVMQAFGYTQNDHAWAITIKMNTNPRHSFFVVHKEDMPELTETTLRAFVTGAIAGMGAAKRQMEGFASLLSL